MNQYPSLEAEPSDFQRTLSVLSSNDLNQFIFSVFFERVGAIETEGESLGQALHDNPDDQRQAESEFRTRLSTVKQNSQTLLGDADQRAREYVFQIRWWAQRLDEAERKSDERWTGLGGLEEASPPPTESTPLQHANAPAVTAVQSQTPATTGTALDQLKAEFAEASSAYPPMNSAPVDLRSGLEANGRQSEPVPAPPNEGVSDDASLPDARMMVGQQQEDSSSIDQARLQQLSVENEEMQTRLLSMCTEMEGLRRDAQRADALATQLEDLRVQTEAEHGMFTNGAGASTDRGRLSAEVEDLRSQLEAARLENEALKNAPDRESDLAAQLDRLQAQVQSVAELVTSRDMDRHTIPLEAEPPGDPQDSDPRLPDGRPRSTGIESDLNTLDASEARPAVDVEDSVPAGVQTVEGFHTGLENDASRTESAWA